MEEVSVIECPRDAMQGIKEFIPTRKKIDYIKLLGKVGFDVLDLGSFVSPKAIPQMRDTAEVLKALDPEPMGSEWLVITANLRGATDAVKFDRVRYLGYPFSISETFQKRNTNASVDESLSRVEEIQTLALSHGKELVVYISMAFGNPYGDRWHPDLAAKWSEKLHKELGVNTLALSDTIGVSKPENISLLFETLVPEFPDVHFGAHFHSTPDKAEEKVRSAYESGCRRFDSAVKGFGGCPMAKDDLTGNLATETLVATLNDMGVDHGLDENVLAECIKASQEVFPI